MQGHGDKKKSCRTGTIKKISSSLKILQAPLPPIKNQMVHPFHLFAHGGGGGAKFKIKWSTPFIYLRMGGGGSAKLHEKSFPHYQTPLYSNGYNFITPYSN